MKKKLNYTLNREHWYCCDFETIHEDTNYWKEKQDTRVVLFHIKNWSNSINVNGVSISEWWSYFWNLGASATLFFHNLKFDGDFILKHLIRYEGFTFTIATTEPKHKTISVFRNGGRIYFIKIFFRKRVGKTIKDINIIIRCSAMLLTSSISDLGKSVGIDKLTTEDSQNKNFYVVEPTVNIDNLPANFVKYCERDCEIMRQSLIALENAISHLNIIEKYNSRRNHNKFNVFNSLTIAALSRRLMKYYSTYYIYENKLEITKPLMLDLQTYKMVKLFYRGGWTQINPKYLGAPKDIKQGVMVDVVSAYPYQMTFNIPYGEILTEKPEGDYYEFLIIDVKKAKIKKGFENCPILKNWKKESDFRYELELDNFTCYYIKQEWDLINKWYDIEINSYSKFYMKATPFLANYAKEVISKKTSFKKEGKKAFSHMFKILANSAYGCLAMRDKFDLQVYINKSDQDNFNNEIYIDNKQYKFKRISETFKVGDYNLNVWDDLNDKTDLPNKAAAAVITTLQRCYLWNMIYKIGVNKFGMSDTDSILFINLSDKDIAKINKLTGSELGSWEIENEEPIKYFGTYGAKKYALLNNDKKEIKLKMSGVTISNLDLKDNFCNYYDLDEPEIEIENAVLSVKYCDSGIMLLRKNKVFKKGTI